MRSDFCLFMYSQSQMTFYVRLDSSAVKKYNTVKHGGNLFVAGCFDIEKLSVFPNDAFVSFKNKDRFLYAQYSPVCLFNADEL